VVGFIGLGYLGHDMAKKIVTKGYELVVMGRRKRTSIDGGKQLRPHGCSRRRRAVRRGAGEISGEAERLTDVTRRWGPLHLLHSGYS
jgi:hypothetical protein